MNLHGPSILVGILIGVWLLVLFEGLLDKLWLSWKRWKGGR